MRKPELLALLIISFSFFISIYFYPQMPKEMAIHWNLNGKPDLYFPKLYGLLLIPFLLLAVLLLFSIIPKIDPLKQTIEKFRNYYEGFCILFLLFLFYVHALIILWNLGARFSFSSMLSPAIGILFYYCGILTENAKRNWFIGIRTPWTLSNEKVWNKTHKLGGKLFKISGAIAFLGIFFQNFSFLLIVIPIIFSVFYLVIYSYLEYKKEVQEPFQTNS